MTIRIAWLYYDILNIYGDRGNILAFIYRCKQRGIKTILDRISIGNQLKKGYYDFIFGGGGQDRQQLLAADDLCQKKTTLQEYAVQDTPMLMICGSYQLFGHYFLTYDQKKITGISIFDCFTVASKIRKIGNVVIRLNPNLSIYQSNNLTISDMLVGFENHSGNTFLNKKLKIKNNKIQTYPLGIAIKGSGNNGQDKTEGAVYRNVIGTYLHGSILPKNPHLADWLITKSLEHHYHQSIRLEPLDDKIEWQTHSFCQKLKK